MNTKYKQLEEALLKEADLLIEKAKSQGEKALYNLFKSAILKKPIIRVRPRDRFYDNYYDGIMTQEERWNIKYEEVKSFIETNKRNPSRHRIEEHDMLNWLKANRKVMNAGKMKPERVEVFERLLALVEQYRRVNQYQ